ncbi:hypothetical protein [Actinomadura gamaensis]|uniref:Uncharacterized protein n=1 Tax=Actinomadura gamaensis TaxID=1763541 RepID=A0ABV9TZ01_9ACTN
MRPTWRDGVATLVMAVNAGVYVAFLNGGAGLPLLAGVRWTTAFVLVLGVVGGCALGRAQDLNEGRPGRAGRAYLAVTTVLGFVAFGAGLIALVTGDEALLAMMFAAVTALWAAATLRHVLGRPTGGPIGPAARTPAGRTRAGRARGVNVYDGAWPERERAGHR